MSRSRGRNERERCVEKKLELILICQVFKNAERQKEKTEKGKANQMSISSTFTHAFLVRTSFRQLFS